MQRYGPALALIAVSLCAGCKDDPAFRTRWSVTDRAGDDPDLNALRCSSNGINQVLMTTFDEFAFLEDARTRPCFPPGWEDPEQTAPGPTLTPGRYVVFVTGVRRDGEPWPNASVDPEAWERMCEENPDECNPCDLFHACDVDTVMVEEGTTPRLTDFVLVPPPECIDGIDNDVDGLIDQFDPACGVADREGVEVGTVLVRLDITHLNANPNVQCRTLTPTVRVSLGDIVLDERTCGLFPVDLSLDLPADTAHTLTVVGLRLGVPVTRAKEVTFETSDAGGAFIQETVDFADVDFLEPIVASTPIQFNFRPSNGVQPRLCGPAGNGTLNIAELSVRMSDAHGGVIDPPVLLQDGLPLDGTPFPCPPNYPSTQTLTWGGYLIAIDALSDQGEICFSTGDAPIPAAPFASNIPEIPRVLDDGLPPASCRDCMESADCDSMECLDGICRPCVSNDECAAPRICSAGRCVGS